MTAAQKGWVYLVGAGPGDPDLLTVKAARLLATADIVLADDLVSPEILAQTNPHALIFNVGKRCGHKKITQQGIHSLMIDAARRNQSVIRLKSGDPLVFGRAAEEIDALDEAGIPYEIVPGITAMFAAAAALRIPLTDRRGASKIILTTGHRAERSTGNSGDSAIWSGDLPEDATLGIYMPGRDLSQLVQQLLSSGLRPSLPCAVVSRAALPGQSVQHTTLAQMENLQPGPAPALVLVRTILTARELDAATNGFCERPATASGHSMHIPDGERIHC